MLAKHVLRRAATNLSQANNPVTISRLEKGKGDRWQRPPQLSTLVGVIVGAFLLWPESNSSIIENESEVAQPIASGDIDPKGAAALEAFVSYLENSDDGAGGGTSTVKAALAAFVERSAVGETLTQTEDESVLTDLEVEAEPADSCALAAPLSSRLITPEGATSLIEAAPVEEVALAAPLSSRLITPEGATSLIEAAPVEEVALAAPLSSRLITPEGATSLIEAAPVEEVALAAPLSSRLITPEGATSLIEAAPVEEVALAAPLSSRLITPEGATSLIEAAPVEEVC